MIEAILALKDFVLFMIPVAFIAFVTFLGVRYAWWQHVLRKRFRAENYDIEEQDARQVIIEEHLRQEAEEERYGYQLTGMSAEAYEKLCSQSAPDRSDIEDSNLLVALMQHDAAKIERIVALREKASIIRLEGYDAAKAGTGRMSNPHNVDRDGAKHYIWDRGWGQGDPIATKAWAKREEAARKGRRELRNTLHRH